tara:strand:+ start:1871 stop:2083 length:213 start_codon:yes stop_codon:yes gene_type:complete
MATNNEIIKIDEIEYKISNLSDECKMELTSLQFCDQQILRLNAELAVVQTARQAYRNAVVSLLPSTDAKH